MYIKTDGVVPYVCILSRFIVYFELISKYVILKFHDTLYFFKNTGEIMDNIKKTKLLLTNKYIILISATLCCLLWGSAFPAIKSGYQLFEITSTDTASQILFAGIRFTLAGFLIFIIASLKAKSFLRIARKNIPRLIILSLFQTVLQYLFFYISLAYIEGSHGAIITSTNVFMAILIASLVFKLDRLSYTKILGCIIGFLGVVIYSGGFSMLTEFALLGEGTMFISATISALATVLIKLYGQRENPVALCAYQFFIGGVVLIFIGIISGGNLKFLSPSCYLIILYLAFVSAGAYTLWSLLLKYNLVSSICVYKFMVPLFGVLLSGIILSENVLTLRNFISLIFVCFGIYIVNRSRPKLNKVSL